MLVLKFMSSSTTSGRNCSREETSVAGEGMVFTSAQKDFQRPADAQVVVDDQYFPDFGSHCHKLSRDKYTT